MSQLSRSEVVLLSALGYFGLGLLTLPFTVHPSESNIVCPAAGFALAVVLIYGRWSLAGLLIGALGLHSISDTAALQGISLAQMLMLVSVKPLILLLQVGAAAGLIHRLTCPRQLLSNSRDSFLLLFIGGPVCCLISPTVGLWSIYQAGLIEAANIGPSWLNWWLGDTIGVLIVTPMLLLLVERRTISTRFSSYKRTLPLALLLVLVLVVVLFRYLLEREERLIEQLFDSRSGNVVSAIQAQTETLADLLYTLKGLFEGSEEVTSTEFNEFAEYILGRRQDILALNWYPRVPASERERFEQGMGLGFHITERNDRGELVPAGQRELYFPVAYLAPFTGNEPAWGYDINSEIVNRRGLWQSVNSNALVATAPIRLQQLGEEQRGVVMRLPVYTKGAPLGSPVERQAALLGLVSIVLQIDVFINANIGRSIFSDLSLRITDTTPGAVPRLLFTDAGFAEQTDHESMRGLKRVTELSVGGRVWHLEMLPAPAFLAVTTSSGLTWILLGTSLLVFLASYTILLLSGRFQFIETEVEQRTEELHRGRTMLEHSEHRFRSLFDQLSNVAIQGFDRNGVLVYWNQQSQRLYGYTSEQVIGRDYCELLVPAAQRQQTRQAIADWLHTGDSMPSLEQSRCHRDGSLVPVYSSYVLIDMPGGDREIYCVDIDLMHLKTIEKDLGESEQRMIDILNNTPVWIMAKNVHGHYTFANQQSAYLLGMEAEAIQGKTVHDMFPAYQAEEFWSHDQQVMELRQARVFEETMTIAGQDRIFLSNRFPLMHDNGELYGVCLVASDITERMRDEMELRKLSMAVKHSPNAVFVTDIDSVIEYVNPKFCQMTGYDEAEVIGNEVSILRSPDSDPVVFEQRWQALSRGQEWHGEYQNRRKDGSCYWVEEYIGPITDDEGAISHFVGIHQDITEGRRISEEMSYQATHDQLTGLINRQEFERRLQRVLEQAKADNSVHALCYLDLDQFKIVNDTSGHIAGDELLRQLATLMSENLRKRDTLARLGGDEFAILMEHCPLEQAQRVGNQIRTLVQEFRFVWQERNYNLGVSIGLVLIDVYALDKIEVMKQADSACYLAKSMGRNRLHVFTRDDKVMSQHQGELEWVSQITHAIDEDRFRLFIQPIVSLHQQHTQPSYEVLLRLQSREGRLIPPGAFFPAAERYNLSSRIDSWVITACFRWLSEHRQALQRMSSISINLSGTSLADERLLDFVLQEFDSFDIPPGSIRFEITETAAVANLSLARAFIHELQKIGCEFALDDFGSGMSSFAYLKNLPVNYLKIDGMFVRDIVDDPIDRAMVRSINDIGQVMGKRTIAEFVENDEILQILCDVGVNFAQGYGLGRPVPIDTLLQDSDH